jgi:3-oxoadipate enol-lactonase
VTAPAISIASYGGDGPLLVLGPSLGTSTVLWRDVAPRLVERFRVVAWDLPGHGDAPAAAEPFTVADLADAVAAAVPPGPFRYAGVSLGGAVGLELALRHPERVAALAAICSGARIGAPDAWAERADRVRRLGTASVVTQSAERWFAPFGIERNPDLAGRLLHALRDADAESYARCCEALAHFDARERLGLIGMPVLAVWGAFDAVTPEASAQEIADGVADGRAVGIPDASHLAPSDDPGAVAGALLDFLDHPGDPT